MVSKCQMHFPSPLRSQIGLKIQMAGCKSPVLGFYLHTTRGNESLLTGGNGPELLCSKQHASLCPLLSHRSGNLRLHSVHREIQDRAFQEPITFSTCQRQCPHTRADTCTAQGAAREKGIFFVTLPLSSCRGHWKLRFHQSPGVPRDN